MTYPCHCHGIFSKWCLNSKGLRNNDCLRLITGHEHLCLPISSSSSPRPWHHEWDPNSLTQQRSLLILELFLLLAPWKGHHTGKQSSSLQAALTRQVWSSQDTSPFRRSVAGKQKCSAGQICKGPRFSTLFWVYLLLEMVTVSPQEDGIMQPVTFSVKKKL